MTDYLNLFTGGPARRYASMNDHVQASESAERQKLTQLAQQEQQFKLNELARQETDNAALRDAFAKNLNPDGTLNREGVLSSLARGNPNVMLGIQKQWAAEDLAGKKSAREMRESELKSAALEAELIGSAAAGVKDQQTYDSALGWLGSKGIDVSKMPQQYDPGLVAQYQNLAVKAKERAENAWKQEGFNVDRAKLAETERHNRAMENRPMGGGGGITGGKAPAGYRWLPDGTMEAVPGGPADRKIIDADTKAWTALSATNDSLDTLRDAAQQLKDHPGLAGNFGMRGKLPNIPGSDAANASALLMMLKSNAGLTVMQNLKQASGAGLGSITEGEHELLQNYLAALDKAQSVEQFQRELDKIIAFTDKSKTRMNDAYQRRQNALNGGGQAAPQQSQSPGKGAIVDGYVFLGGDASDPKNWKAVRK